MIFNYFLIFIFNLSSLERSSYLLPHITFGKCLKLLLSTLNISMNKLAKAIHVDNSLVNRWVNEKRLPPQGSSYIERIADYLATCMVDTYDIQLVEEIFSQLEVNDKLTDISNTEKIRRLLYNSLNHSRQRLENSNNKYLDPSINKQSLPPSKTDIPRTDGKNGISLSSNDQVIHGISKIYSAVISLIETATIQKNKPDNIIYLTHYSDLDYSFFTETRIVHFRNTLSKAIENGWNILYVLRLDDNKEKLIRLIHFLLPIIRTGKVNIYYLSNYDNYSIAKEMCVVSGIGALSCYPVDQSSTINCGFYLKTTSAIDVFTNYLNILLRENAQSLIKYYPQVSNEEYHLNISTIKQKEGNIYYYNWGFSLFLLPEKLYEKLLSRTTLTKEVQQLSFDNYKMQLSTFTDNIQRHSCNIIYLSEFIENLIHHRTLSLYTYSGIEIVTLEPIEIIEFLENIIHFISLYTNFHVGIIFHNDDPLMYSDSFHLFIKERKAVFLNIYGASMTVPKVRLFMKEPMITKGFVEYFKFYWEQIAPVNRNKNEIVSWLQSCIDIVKRINHI